MFEIFALLAFTGLLIYAACSDVATMTIPNWVSIALASLFPIIALATGMPLSAIGMHLLFGFGVLVICFLLFQIQIMGGGDAKLIAAAAVWTGFGAFGTFALGTALTGGLIALILIFVRKRMKPAPERRPFVNRLLKMRGGVPYGVAIMAGGLMVLGALPFAASPLTLP